MMKAIKKIVTNVILNKKIYVTLIRDIDYHTFTITPQNTMLGGIC